MSDFGEWLETHQFIKPFLTIRIQKDPYELIGSLRFWDYRREIHRQAVFMLEKYIYHQGESTKSSFTSLVHRPPPKYWSYGLLFNKLAFIEQKIFHLKQKNSIGLLKCLNLLLVMYSTHDFIPNNMIIALRTDLLFSHYSNDSSQIKSLSSAFISFLNQYNAIVKKRLPLDLQKHRIYSIIKHISMSYDEKTSFFPPSPLQQSFEHLLLYPDSCCYKQITHIFENFIDLRPQELNKIIIQIAGKIAKQYHLNNDSHISIIIGFLYRFIYDEVYPYIPDFHARRLQCDILQILRYLKLEDIDPPMKYFDSRIPNVNFFEHIRNDPHYKSAVDTLELISFFTNPLDILRGVSYCIKEIEKAASHYSKTKDIEFLSFEAIFGLFCCIVLSSCIPDFRMISSFVISYSPTYGLSGSFEYGLSTIRALSIHLSDLEKKQTK